MSNPARTIRFPIDALPEGPFAEAAEPDDPSWETIAPWTDPHADRGAFGRDSLKARIDDAHGPAVRFGFDNESWRGLVRGEKTWRDYTVSCRVILDQTRVEDMGTVRMDDGVGLRYTMAGLVFRLRTNRHYYYFCIEENRRLVLYRRADDDWHVLNWRNADLPEGPVTLTASVEGDTIRVACPEADIDMSAVDHAYAHGVAGFRVLGEARLYDLRIEMTAEQAAVNEKAQRQEAGRVRQLGKDVPDAVHAATWDTGDDELITCTNFAAADRTDFLWRTPGGVEARTWEGEVLWRCAEKTRLHEIGPLRENGSRTIYLMAGERQPGEKQERGGNPSTGPVADAVLVLDGASGETIMRTELPVDPGAPGYLNRWDFSAEVGFGEADGEPDFLVRQWCKYIGNGGVHLWMYDRTGTLLWYRKNNTVYGHHNAVHWGDVDRDGKPEVIAGGSCYDAQGNLLWTHNELDEIERFDGAGSHTGHYDAVLVQSPDDWPDADPLLFYITGATGVQVVDATSGVVRTGYRTGHAQNGQWCRVRDDIPGRQVLADTRWGTYGILTLLSATGERLWTMSPDFVGEYPHPIRWRADGPELIWVSTTTAGMGLYDGHGRLVKPLDAVRKTHGRHTQQSMRGRPLLRRPGGRHWMALVEKGKLHLFRPEDDG